MSQGQRLQISHAEYRQLKAVNQSGLKTFIENPEAYYRTYVTGEIPETPPTESMLFGIDAERYIVHGRLPEGIVEIPATALSESGRRQGKAWEEWSAQYPAGTRLLKPHEFAAAVGPLEFLKQQVLEHPRARALMTNAQTQVVIAWVDDETGLPCKAEIDLCSPRGVNGDFKTTIDPSPESFSKSIEAFGYHIQDLWYRTAWRELTGDRLPFVFVAARNQPPYNVETYDLHQDWLDLAHTIIRYGMQRLAKCYESGNWRSPTWGEVKTLDILPWAKKQLTYLM